MYVVLDDRVSLLLRDLGGYEECLLSWHHPYPQQGVAGEGGLMGEEALGEGEQVDRVLLVWLYVTQAHPGRVGEPTAGRKQTLTSSTKPRCGHTACLNIL